MKPDTFSITANIPDSDEFAGMYPQYGNMAQNNYRALFNQLMSAESYLKGHFATQLGLPAISGVTAIIKPYLDQEPDDRQKGLIKQYAGAVMCSLMLANEYEKTGTKRAVGFEGFNKGEFYRLRAQNQESAPEALSSE
jgi:hypothetical protein